MADSVSQTVPCPRCSGAGRVVVSVERQALLRLLTTPQTAPELHARMGALSISVTAINNHLEYMRRGGLLKRQKDGRAWRYSRASK